MDIRDSTAKYYDAGPAPFDGKDIAFHEALIPSPQARVLELGCGTGRVLIPLARRCAFIQGIDQSAAMLDACREGLARAGIGPDRAAAAEGDITDLRLGQRFDLITAPFRVMQNLETDEQVDGLFATLREHLAPGGSAVLNAFRPFGDPDTLVERWERGRDEQLIWEIPYGGGKLARYDRIERYDTAKLIVYPALIYRLTEGGALKDEAILRIAMRAYMPDEFAELATSRGFALLNQWGGYSGEAYGEGPELVIQFGL